jgi:hypothetical protein
MPTISRYRPARFRRSVIAPRLLERLKKSQIVVGGPFKGMRYDGGAVCGAATPKILGVYESELAPFLLKWSVIPFQHIINVGAAEGYYAVGCATLWPQATVTAFEASEEGRRFLARNVQLNGLQSRVKMMGYCGQELWFRDPALVLGDPVFWDKPRALRESNCHQRREMAIRYCARMLEPPFVNSGIVALHGELMAPELLRSMVQDALRDPQDSSREQTIIATAVKLGGDFFPKKLSLVEFDDVHRFRSRNMRDDGFYSRHYVNWMRHLLYRDALKLPLHVGRRVACRSSEARCLTSIETTERV